MERFESRFERGDRFESREQSPFLEDSQKGLRQIAREELQRLRWETTDAFTYEIALKGLAKLELKDEVDRIQKYMNDVTVRQPMKRLGSLVVVEGVSRLTYNDEKLGFQIRAGDPYIDIHVPPLNEAEKQRTSITNSFAMLADYIQRHDVPGEYLVGITYQKLARVSQHFGFTVVDLNLPTELTRGVERVYERFQEEYGLSPDMGNIQLCFQSKEAFLSRFQK